jgi:hypothetical protein
MELPPGVEPGPAAYQAAGRTWHTVVAWSEWRDSNPSSSAWKAEVLPLDDTRMERLTGIEPALSDLASPRVTSYTTAAWWGPTGYSFTGIGRVLAGWISPPQASLSICLSYGPRMVGWGGFEPPRD